MNVFDAMKGRQSIRKFRKDPVPREQILRMVEAATWAPSAGNTQNVRFLVVEDPALLSRMKGIVDEILARVTGKEIPPGKINYHNLFPAAPAPALRAAYSLGYGTCWMTGPLVAKPELESALSLRPPEELLAVVALGKPDSSPPKPPRKPPEEVTEFRSGPL